LRFWHEILKGGEQTKQNQEYLPETGYAKWNGVDMAIHPDQTNDEQAITDHLLCPHGRGNARRLRLSGLEKHCGSGDHEVDRHEPKVRLQEHVYVSFSVD
jgi:hypothetical protein